MEKPRLAQEETADGFNMNTKEVTASTSPCRKEGVKSFPSSFSNGFVSGGLSRARTTSQSFNKGQAKCLGDGMPPARTENSTSHGESCDVPKNTVSVKAIHAGTNYVSEISVDKKKLKRGRTLRVDKTSLLSNSKDDMKQQTILEESGITAKNLNATEESITYTQFSPLWLDLPKQTLRKE